MATDAWQLARERITRLWRGAQPARAADVAAELDASNEDVRAARTAGDQETLDELRAQWRGRFPRPRTETALRALLDHSLTELVDLGAVRCARSHGVLLDSVAAATPPEEAAAVDATAVRLLDAAVPAVPDAGPYDPRLRLLAPHVLALLRRFAGAPGSADVLAVATRLAVALHRTGDYLSAWETVRTAAALGERTLGAEHRVVLAAHSRTGRALFRLGRYAEAEALLRRTHAAQARLFGPDDPDTLDSTHGLALVLGNLGRRAEALAFHRSTAAGRRAALGARHPLTLRSRSSLLAVLTSAELGGGATSTSAQEGDEGENDSALLSLPEECVEHLGADHTVTVGARHNRAWALFLLGRFAEADAEIEEVTGSYLRRFGPDYPITLAARQLHARTQSALGHTEAGIALMTEVVAHREQSLGHGHPFTLAGRDLLRTLAAGRGTA